MDLKTGLAILATLIFWASAFVGIRAGLADYSPGHLALLRFLTASTALAIYALVKRMPLPDKKDIPRLVVHGFFGFTVYHLFLNYGEQTVSAASAAFLIGAIPIFTTILAVIMLGEKIPRKGIWGILVGFIGIGIISFGEGGELSLNWGTVMVLVAAFSESLFMALQKPYLKKYSPTQYVSYTMWAGTALMLIYAPGFGHALATASLRSTIGVVYLGIFPAAVAYITWAYALSKADVSKVVTSQFLIPVFTIIIGFVWIGELPSLVAVAGGIVALAGVGIIAKK